ncbi:oligosaccharide flippase family protein [Actibacterium lipolyticum]|nr:oligosaccharide flippase family protein [Actibacterium lipolyticum]
MFRSALLLLSGNAFSSLMLLVRNLLVARLISVEDYGIAATFALSMAIVEMISQLGLQQLIVQAKDGEDPKLQAGLQGFQALRGLLAGGFLLLIAYPLANFLGVPEVAWAYQLMALVPVLNGFVHFDVFRLQRQMIYLPHILTISVPALVSVALVWPLNGIFGDYRVMLYAVLAQGVLTLVTSHLVAKTRYRATLDRSIMARGLGFGWPLLINGLLLFAVFNGEKLVIGRELGMVPLAMFAMGFTLTLTPTLVLARSLQSFFLPQLSAANDPDRFERIGAATIQANILNGLLQIAAIMLLGPLLVESVLGEKYAPLVPLLLWLSILQAVRVFKSGPAVVALAKAKTDNAMWANLCRVASLPLSWYLAANGYDLINIIWVAIGAELVAMCVSLFLLGRRVGYPLSRVWGSIAVALGFMVALALRDWFAQDGAAPIWTSAVCIAMFGLSLASMTALKGYVMARVAR